MNVEAAAHEWFMGHVRLTIEGFTARSTPARLAGRIRGALGAALQDTASPAAIAGAPCTWTPPCALDLLFRTQGRITPALEVPKPWVIATTVEGDLLHVDVHLVGFASECLEEVSGAVVQAWRQRLPDARGSRIVDRRVWTTDRVEFPERADAIVLAFHTPVEIRYRDGAPDSPAAAMWSLLASLGNRVSGLARWQDTELDADFSALRESARALSITGLFTEAEDWTRRSFRQNRVIPMQGVKPVLRIAGDLAPFLPWLALGAVTHVGSHAALGMGRYSLMVEGKMDAKEATS